MVELNPLVTVLIPTYNSGDYLKESLQSVLDQSYKKIEILIIDDGSTDGTLENLFKIQDARVRILSNDKNLGLGPTLNRGVSEAKGIFIARHDHDDISYPNRIEHQLKFLIENPDVIVVGSAYDILHSDGSTSSNQLSIYPLSTISRVPVHHPTSMYRKDFVWKHKCRYAGIAEDFTFWNDIFAANNYAPDTFVNLDQAYICYRLHDRQITQDKKKEIFNFYKEETKVHFLRFCINQGFDIELRDNYTVRNIHQFIKAWKRWEKPSIFENEACDQLFNKMIDNMIFREFEKRSLRELIRAKASTKDASLRNIGSLIKWYLLHTYFNKKLY